MVAAPPLDPPVTGRPGRLGRAAYLSLGFVSVGVGAVGVVVPVLPSTVFFIVAASCFARSNPRFERWVLDLPHVGPMVRDHRAGLGMPRRAKRVAVAMMWTAIALSAVTLRDLPVVVGVVVALGVAGTAWIRWRVPTREVVLAAAPTDHDR